MAFDFHHLLLVFTAYIIGAVSPGPSNLRIMGVAMHQGRQPALLLAAGVISGSIFWGALAATGVSAILTQYAQALGVLKVLGGAYLLFLAFNKQLDLQSLLTAVARCQAMIQGWYESSPVIGYSVAMIGIESCCFSFT